MEYRETGLTGAVLSAKELAEELGVELVFKHVEPVRRVRQRLDCTYENGQSLSPETKFKIEFFNTLMDIMLVSIKERFDQLTGHCQIWNFLYSLEDLPTRKEELLDKCKKLENYLTSDEVSDINAAMLCDELMSIRGFFSDDSTPKDILRFIKKSNLIDLYPNVWISTNPTCNRS